MMPRRTQVLAAAVVGVMLAGSATAQTRDEQWQRCKGDNPDLRIGACTALIQSGQETTANLAAAFHNRGIGYYDTDQFDKAIADDDQAIKLNPSSNAFYERGLAYWAKREYTRALQDFDEAIRLQPTALSYVTRGNVHDDNGQLDLAIQDYASAIKLEPSNARAYGERCVAYATKGAYDAAITDCDKAIQLNPGYANAFANRGRSYVAKGDNDRALADFDKALALNSSKVAANTAFKNRALVRFKRGEYQLAIRDYDAALKLYPQSAESLYGRGAAKRLSGDTAAGEQDIASATQLQANIAAVMAARGVR